MKQFLALLMSITLALPACATNVARKMEDSTVMLRMKVKSVKKNKTGWGTCSAVYVQDNVLLSAAHCVDMPDGMILTQIWMRQNDVSARVSVLKIDPSLDLLLLSTPIKGTPVKLARHVRRGDTCFVIGNPLGIENTITKGIVSKINFNIPGRSPSYIIVDAVALPGNSGGAVVDAHGKLIGILVMSTSMLGPLGASGLGIAVSIKDIKDFIEY